MAVSTPASAKRRYRPIWSSTVPAPTGPPPVPAAGRAAARVDGRDHSVGARPPPRWTGGSPAPPTDRGRHRRSGAAGRPACAPPLPGRRTGCRRRRSGRPGAGSGPPRSADEDGHVLLQRSWIADGLGHAKVRPRRGATRSPHDREQAAGCPRGGRTARRSTGTASRRAVLPLPPGQAQPADGPAAAQDVEGGHDLGQVGGVAKGDAGDEGAEADGRVGRPARPASSSSPAGRPSAGRPRDLQHVVHHPQAGETDGLGQRGRFGYAARRGGAFDPAAERRQLQPEAQRAGPLPTRRARACRTGRPRPPRARGRRQTLRPRCRWRPDPGPSAGRPGPARQRPGPVRLRARQTSPEVSKMTA